MKETKMFIYKVHLLRVIALILFLLFFITLLILTNPPQNCIQVSVSLQQFRPYHVKRTRDVQAVEETTKIRPNNFIVDAASKTRKFNTDAFFRTRIVKSGVKVDLTNDSDVEDGDDYGADADVDVNAEDYDYDDLPSNKVFEEGDFDYNATTRNTEKLDFSVVSNLFYAFKNGDSGGVNSYNNYSSQRRVVVDIHVWKRGHGHKLRNITLINVEGVPVVEDGIFWSDEIEKMAPKGLLDSDVQMFLQNLRNSKVKRVEPPTWNRCGRPKNQYVVFEDNSKACARYRAPHQYLVQGEILSFYLARLLGITNVPVVALSAVEEDFRGQWNTEGVKKNLIASKWETNTTVALIQWIENLERDKLPRALLSSLINKKLLSGNSAALLSLPVTELVELLQWSDLIIFDYITGNYDRVASMQDAADKEKNPSIMKETIHNLVRSKTDGGLWLIDNESGLLDSYSLLYGPAGQDGRFLNFHKQMLNTTCLFRRSTVERISWLHLTGESGKILEDVVQRFEPLFLPIAKSEKVWERLQERIGEVYSHIEYCRNDFA